MITDGRLAGSFRDPSGFVFIQDGIVLRCVTDEYRADYDCLMESGLYDELTAAGLLVAHVEIDPASTGRPMAYRVVRPDQIPLISYPYEWSFGQLKAAAHLTLEIQQRALARGMTLKDASAYNVQFRGYQAVLIDTLSFERYREGSPWVAYRQFCQHFLAPLALMSRRDIRLAQLSRLYVDGVPLSLATRLLPRRTLFAPSLFLHLHMHGRAERRAARLADSGSRRNAMKRAKISRRGLLGMLGSLRSAIAGLHWEATGTEWADYHSEDSYSAEAFASKHETVARFIEAVSPRSVWDLGANTGEFSRLAARRGAYTVSFDIDPAAVERNFVQAVRDRDRYMLPLLQDLANPSSHLGWAESERLSLRDRGPTDLVMALALIHHLAISNGVPLERIAEYLASLSSRVIVEFVPKKDPRVQLLLASREDIFRDYTKDGFERAFQRFFRIDCVRPINDSKRILYLLTGRASS